MQTYDHNMGLKKNANLAKNYRKSQKILIITSTPGLPAS
jgi:hypothetical protein